MADFPDKAILAPAVFWRSYSRRKPEGDREKWSDTCNRTISALARLGDFTPEEVYLVTKFQSSLKVLPSGRWLWVGGSEWAEKPENYYGAYNCSSLPIVDPPSFGLMMSLAMMGCGTGAMLEPKFIDKLPKIKNFVNINVLPIGDDRPSTHRRHDTDVNRFADVVIVTVGDSRKGWVDAYQSIIEIAADESFDLNRAEVLVDLRHVRPAGELLKGFGGVANPVKLPGLFPKIARILEGAIGRQLNSLECCLLLDEAATVIVAGNIRRSAGIRQGAANDELFATAKDNLWQQDETGKWKIDESRDALRMSNHTRVFHRKPTLEECTESVKKQYYSGEGAIQWAGESIARGNADIFRYEPQKKQFLKMYAASSNSAEQYLVKIADKIGLRLTPAEISHRMLRYGMNPCGEILGVNFLCNLSEIHLNQLDPSNLEEQVQAFAVGALSAAALLHQRFDNEKFQYSRQIDPIVGVSFTGLFDFFVNLFGIDWLHWWQEGRPETPDGERFKSVEREYLTRWKEAVHNTVTNYCDRHYLRAPNRCTTVQPGGTKSLLTGASPGWHPPKAQRFIRRMTFGRDDAIALALRDYGYNLIPSADDKDEKGQLLDDPFDKRCTTWLVEFPVEVGWANLPGVDEIDISQFSALAQFDFCMQVQRHYVTHNTSSTIELRENEIQPLAERVYSAIQNDEGYVSATLLARFDDRQTYPRLPFEPISKEVYEQLNQQVLARRRHDDLNYLLRLHDNGTELSPQDSACDGGACERRATSRV